MDADGWRWRGIVTDGDGEIDRWLVMERWRDREMDGSRVRDSEER